MTVVTRLGPRDFRPQPWKNGGGTTTELAVFPATGRPLWRVSIAEVAASGPFSDFSGYERTLMLLDGDGMVLDFDAAEPATLDRRFQSLVFDGAWKCDCTLLGGPVRDLNLMVDRTFGRGTVEVITGRAPITRATPAEWMLLCALEGRATVGVEGAEYPLSTGEVLRIDGPAATPMSLSCDAPSAAVALLVIERRR
jgi:environmental stress-induced protein Ves